VQKLLAFRGVGYYILKGFLVDFDLLAQIVQFGSGDRNLFDNGRVNAVARSRGALATGAVARALDAAYIAAVASVR
jgi:hypothetical protein